MPMTPPDPALLDGAVRAGRMPDAVRAGLADPLARIAVTTVARDGMRRLDCYAMAGEDERLAAVTPDANGGAAISFPVNPALPEALLVETLGLDQPFTDLGHRSEVDVAALWALAAMVDAHRQLELESLLARAPAHQLAVDEDTIYLRALDGATLPDPRWLSALLTHLIGPGDIAEASLHHGLAALARAGLIARGATGLWSPQSSFAAAFAHLQLPLAGVRLAIDRRDAAGGDHLSLVFLRTLAAVWIVELRGPADATTTALLRSAAGDDARGFARRAIAAALARKPAAPKPAQAADKPQRFCRQCGRPAAATDRFCGSCGTELG